MMLPCRFDRYLHRALAQLACGVLAVAFTAHGVVHATVLLNGGQSLTLDGPGQSLSSAQASAVGRSPGIATLNILNAATLGSSTSGVGTIGSNIPGIEGRVLIDGAGSRWVNTGRVIVGHNAVGRVSIANGANLTASSPTTDPAMWIGVRTLGTATTTGNVSVDGIGSTLSLSGQLTIGNGSSAGSLSVTNGASVTSSLSVAASVHSGVIGFSGGTGYAHVDGDGSRWTQDGRLAVGTSGQSSFETRGELVVSNGGEVIADSVIFGATSAQSQGPPGIGVGTISGGRLIADTFITVGRGSFTIQGDSNVIAGGGLGLSGTGTVSFNSGKLDAGDIGLLGGRLRMNSDAPLLLRARSISYPIPNFFGGIDLGAGGSAFDYSGTTSLSSIHAELVRGRNNGSWTGHGITSSLAAANPQSHGVGIAEAAETGLTELFGETFDDTTVIVRYTLLGDATLDGAVDISDFANVAANFNQPGRWFMGDFDFSGATEIGDFALMAANFNQSLPADAGRTAVPEPAVGVLAILLITSIPGRIRDHRRSARF